MSADENLIKSMFCKDASPQETEMFLTMCRRTGLDPFTKQIYFIKRDSSMMIHVSIDGCRLVAERTGNYSPGRESTYHYEEIGGSKVVVSATSYIKKRTSDGVWHEVSATAHYDEYVQLKKDNTPTKFWRNMPHVMLAKCAESIALRKAFPSHLSGLYTSEEMGQSKKVSEEDDRREIEDKINTENEPLSLEQTIELITCFEKVKSEVFKKEMDDFAKLKLNATSIYHIKQQDYERILNRVKQRIAREETDAA